MTREGDLLGGRRGFVFPPDAAQLLRRGADGIEHVIPVHYGSESISLKDKMSNHEESSQKAFLSLLNHIDRFEWRLYMRGK